MNNTKYLRYSLLDLIKEYNKLKTIKENYSPSGKDNCPAGQKYCKVIDGCATEEDCNNDKEALQIIYAIVIPLLIINFAIWLWALIVLIKFWKDLPDWAKIIGIIGLFPIIPFGPVISLICIYIGKNKK